MSGRYTPLKIRSSVESMASNLASFATSPLTKSRARRAADAGQWRDTVRSRLLNAADRQGGAVLPDVRGEKMRVSARNRMSMTDEFADFGPDERRDDEGWVSSSEEKVRGSRMEYSVVTKSDKSMFSASPKYKSLIVTERSCNGF